MQLKIKLWISHVHVFHRIKKVGAGGEGAGLLSLMTFSEKLSNFKVHKLSRIANELCTFLIIDEEKSSNIDKTYEIN